MQTVKKRGPAVLWTSLVALLTLTATVPSLLQDLPMGHDVVYHCMRLLNIAEEMKSGNPFPAVYTFALNGMGYGAPLFYSDLFMYPFAALTALGLDIRWSFKLLQASLLLMSVLSMYLCARSIFKNRAQAMLTALAYSFSYYSLADIYFRVAIGECFGFVFLPIVYLGYYDSTPDRPHRWWILSLGMAGILFSHVLSVLLAAAMLIVLMIFDARYWIRNAARIRYLVYAALLCIGLSCCFWLPMLEQMSQLSFRLNMDVNGTDRYRYGLYSPLRLLAPPELVLLIRPSDYSQTPRLGSLFGDLAYLIALIALWRNKERRPFALLATGAFFLWMSGNYSPSRWFAPLLAVLQFGWRFLLPAMLPLAVFAGAGYGALKSTRWRRAMIAMVALSAASAILFAFPLSLYEKMERRAESEGVTPEEFTTAHLNCNEISDGQYLPDDLYYVKDENDAYILPEFEAAASDPGVSIELSRDEKNRLVVRFAGNPGGATIDLPVILYIGYAAETVDGERLPVSRGESGMVRVSLGEHESGEFTLRYAGTTLQTASKIVTLLSILAFAVILLWQRKREIAEN